MAKVKNTAQTGTGLCKAVKKKSAWKTFKKSIPLLTLALPAIIYLFVFNYIPMYGLVLPFKDYKPSKGFFASDWAGLENFELIFNNPEIATATWNTIFYNLVFIVVGTAAAVFVALMLYELTSKSVKFYQTTMFLPHFISWVVAAYAAYVFLDMDYGILNKLLVAFGAEPIMWYNAPEKWPAIIVIAETWKTVGYNAVIYYAALMGTDKSLFEAARVDGANKFRQTWHIAIPGIKSMITIMVIMKVGKVFYGDFGLFYNVTKNSSLLYKTTDIIDTYVYRALRVDGDIGLSSAVTFYQSVLGFILVVVTNAIVKKFDDESALF